MAFKAFLARCQGKPLESLIYFSVLVPRSFRGSKHFAQSGPILSAILMALARSCFRPFIGRKLRAKNEALACPSEICTSQDLQLGMGFSLRWCPRTLSLAKWAARVADRAALDL
jgi:hypothetical protein